MNDTDKQKRKVVGLTSGMPLWKEWQVFCFCLFLFLCSCYPYGLVIFCSGMLKFLSFSLCMYYGFLAYGYNETYMKQFIFITVHFKLIITKVGLHSKVLHF